jgi:hypothetical protein
MTLDPIASIRYRLAQQIEQAARDVEAELDRDRITQSAYDQGRRDERRRVDQLLSHRVAELEALRGSGASQLRVEIHALRLHLNP